MPPEFKGIDPLNVTRVMAGGAAYSRDWLLGDPAAQRPELGPPLHLEGGRPRQPRRAQLGTQAGPGLSGPLPGARGPAGAVWGPPPRPPPRDGPPPPPPPRRPPPR